MVKLFTFYFDQQGEARIDASKTMKKYKGAYMEAAEKLKNLDYYELLTTNGEAGKGAAITYKVAA